MRQTLDSLDTVVEKIVDLDPKPRSKRWTSLTFCILDAVWSIGARYDSVVVPVVRGFAQENGITECTIDARITLPDDPYPASRLAELKSEDLREITNSQRTSTRGGILKAEASIKYAQVLNRHGVTTLAEATALLAREGDLAVVERELAQIPGDGQHGIRRGYLWMLVGDDNRIKPDRMVLRWFERVGVPASPGLAKDYILAAAPLCSEKLGRPTTPWEIDHAIWLATRG